MVKNKEKIKVSVIILTRNSLEMTKGQLHDISKLNTHGLEAECMVVDNNSSDGTEKVLKKFRLPNMSFSFIQSGANLGFAGGNNVGIDSAINRNFKYIILMNNDLVLPIDLIQKLVTFMDKNPEIGIVSPKMYFARGYESHKDRYNKEDLGKVIWYAGGLIDWKNIYSSHRGVDEVDNGQFDKTIDTDFANGACMIIRKEVFTKIGKLDESLFLYWEDADFSVRAKNAGFNIKYYPGTKIWHKVSSSTGGSGSYLNDYFLTRNRFYFAIRYARFYTKLAVLKDTLKLVLVGREWQKKGAKDAILGIKGIGSWGEQ